MTPQEPPAVRAATPKRWPLALLVGVVTGLAGACFAVPVSDWAMEAHRVSNMEGGRAYAAVGIFAPLGFLVGGIIGFGLSLWISGNGFIGYLKRQGISLVAMSAVVLAVGGFGYVSADHPPLVDGRPLALEIEVRVPARQRTIEQLKAEEFSIALVVSDSDRGYSDMRWAEATATGEFITLPAWAILRSRSAGREITAGLVDENRQIFVVTLPPVPGVSDSWSEWKPPRALFDGSMPTPEDQSYVRYRVRFLDEYTPTPRPDWPAAATPEPSPTPE